MTITDEATFPETGVVRLERVLDARIERVWEYLASTELRKTWLGGGTLDLMVGGKVRIFYDHTNLTDHTQRKEDNFRPHVEEGIVLAVDPPRLLSYTWGEWFGQSCVVRFTLSPIGDRTQLVLEHSRIATDDLGYDVARGWHVHLEVLAARIDGSSPPNIWDRFDQVGAYYRSLGTSRRA